MIDVVGREICIEGRLLRTAYPHGDRYCFLDDPAPVVNALRAYGTRVELFTFGQRLADAEPKFDYPVEWDNLAVLPVTTFDNWWTHQIGNKTRNEVRLAEKRAVVVREAPFDESLLAGIRDIYNECPIRQRRRFPHFGKDLDAVRRDEATFLNTSIFIGAFVEGKLIGFVKLVPDETCTQAGLMNILSMRKHRNKAPQNALIAYAVRACANRGIRFLVYSKFDYGNKRNDGLRAFKEHNGFRRVETPRYYVPLTPIGWIAFHLGLHRGLSDRIPSPIAGMLRHARAAWYEHRYRSVMKPVQRTGYSHS